jgi:sporulation protein YlmC with PRC-barrel domain
MARRLHRVCAGVCPDVHRFQRGVCIACVQGSVQMFTAFKELVTFEVRARDGGLLGKLHDLSFDDASWRVRHLIVDPTGWLPHRILMHPLAVHRLDPEIRRIELMVTRSQVEGGPAVDTDQPLSRSQTERYYRHFGWPAYWQPLAWGHVHRPTSNHPGPVTRPAPTPATPGECDPHLRSARALLGCLLQVHNHRVGQVDDVLVDTGTWEMGQLVVDGGRWWAGKQTLGSPQLGAQIDWVRRLIHFDGDREGVGPSAFPQHDLLARSGRTAGPEES